MKIMAMIGHFRRGLSRNAIAVDVGDLDGDGDHGVHGGDTPDVCHWSKFSPGVKSFQINAENVYTSCIYLRN